MPRRRVAVIIGAGPAGLTAALELLERTDVTPIVLEASDAIGGLARTVEYKGNRMDIGGHRFFSKSERVNAWWLRQMPREAAPENADHVLLLRPRRSRIYFLRQFFAYPLALSADTLRRLGWRRSAAIAASYAAAHVRPQTAPRTMEEFFVQRFGRRLYETFFKSYTEKVWGVPCAQIPARWGAQRIRGLSLWRRCGMSFGGGGGVTRVPLRRRPCASSSCIQSWDRDRCGSTWRNALWSLAERCD